MIDIHCHLMPSVDDGAKDLNETLAMFENAYTSGVTDMILTPVLTMNWRLIRIKHCMTFWNGKRRFSRKS